MHHFSFKIAHPHLFQQQLLHHFSAAESVVFLNSNSPEKKSYFAVANRHQCLKNEWQFGFISYDYKNNIEQLSSNHEDHIAFPEKHFFTPEWLFVLCKNEATVYYDAIHDKSTIVQLVNDIKNVVIPPIEHSISIPIKSKMDKSTYLEKVAALKQHIQLGDIYEVNFCQEFFAENVTINPINYYLLLNKKSPTPFSCFVKHHDKYLLCASPERFIQKNGSNIISQPIKGTIKRGLTTKEDEQLKQQLITDKKERSENIMIVDLVRNDLSKIAKKNTVEVDELCGIYTFPQVHQMISTIKAKLQDNTTFDDIIKALFPMGSMTGAPKISAMQLIEKYETTKRGLYSGSAGYINSEGDFDFNVVIRSLAYNSQSGYLSFMVGGAITALSDPEKEYEECLLKAKAMMEVLQPTIAT